MDEELKDKKGGVAAEAASDASAEMLRRAQEAARRGDADEASLAYLHWCEAGRSLERYLAAAQAVEALGVWGRAEFLYCHAIKYGPRNAAAQEGHRRVLARKAPPTPAEGVYAASDRKGALSRVVSWAEGEATTTAFLDAAQVLAARGEREAARHLTQRALSLEPESAVAREVLRRIEAVSPRARVADLRRTLEAGLRDRAVEEARQEVTSWTDLDDLAEVHELLSKHGLLEAVLAVLADVPGAVLLRWLDGRLSKEEVMAAGVSDETKLRRFAGLRALRRARWTEAADELAPVAGPQRIVAIYKARGLAAALAESETPSLDDLLIRVLSTERQLPEPRPIDAPQASEHAETLAAALKDAREGRLEDAAHAYQRVRRAGGAVASQAKLNEALVRVRLRQFDQAADLLAELRVSMGREHAVMWALAVCALERGARADCLEALDAVLKLDPLHRQARLWGAAIMAHQGDHARAIEHLSSHPGGALKLTKNGAMLPLLTFLLRCCERAGQAEVASGILDGVLAAILGEEPAPAPAAASPAAPTKAGKAATTQAKPVKPPSQPAKKAAAKPEPARPRLQLPPTIVEPGLSRQLQAWRLHREDPVEIREALRELVAKVPGFVKARYLLAGELQLQGMSAQAEEELLRCLPGATKTDLRFPILKEIVALRRGSGRFEDAAELLERENVATWTGVAVFAPFLGSFAQDDPSGLGWFVFARLRRAQGAPGPARDALERAVQVRLHDPRVRRACEEWAPDLLDRYVPSFDAVQREVERMIKGGLHDQARDFVVQATRKVAGDRSSWQRLEVRVLRAMGRDAEAAVLLEQLVAASGRRDDRLALGQVLSALRREGDERDLYLRILDEDPFDVDVLRRLRDMGHSHLFDVPLDHPELLVECSRVLREGNSIDAANLYERLRRDLQPAEIEPIARLLVKKQHASVWRNLLADVAAASDGATAPLSRAGAPAAPARAAASSARPPAKADRNAAPPGAAPNEADALARRQGEVWRLFKDPSLEKAPWVDLCAALAPHAWAPFAESPSAADARARDDVASAIREMVGWAQQEARRRNGRARVGVLLEEVGLRRLRLALAPAGASNREELEALTARVLTVLADFDESSLRRAALELTGGLAELGGSPDTRRYLAKLASVAGDLLALEETASWRAKDFRKVLAEAVGKLADLDTLRDAVLDEAGRVQVARLSRAWRGALDELDRRAQKVPRLRVRLGDPVPDEQDPEAFFQMLHLENVGAETARDIKLRLWSDEHDVFAEREAADLPGGREGSLSLRVPVARRERAVEVRIELTYYAGELFPNEKVSESKVLAPPWGLMAKAVKGVSFYRAGSEIAVEDPSYISRTELLDDIRDTLGQRGRSTPVLVHGMRRIGKSTLLKGLIHQPPPGDRPVILDCAGVCSDREKLSVADLLERCVGRIASSLRVATPSFDERGQHDPTAAFERFLEAQSSESEGRILLMFDEFESLLLLVDVWESKGIGQGFLGWLRHLMQHLPGVAFVLVGADKVHELVGRYDTPLFNMLRDFSVEFLDREQSQRLIRRPLEGSELAFRGDAVDYLVEQTAGHPLLLQEICQRTIDESRRRNELIRADVERAIQVWLGVNATRTHSAIYEAMFKFVASDAQNRLLLSTLARAEAEAAMGETRWLGARELSELLSGEGCDLGESLFPRLLRLAGRLLLAERIDVDDRREWRIKMPLFKTWLLKHANHAELIREAREAQPGGSPT